MKAYTDLEQSKRLAEILPIESADMALCNNSIRGVNYTDEYSANLYTIKEMQECFDKALNGWDKYWELIPCWSLAALLDILPTTIGNFFEKNALRIRMDKGETDFNIWYENFDCNDVAEGLDVKENNPVDACYEMILKLNEQKLL